MVTIVKFNDKEFDDKAFAMTAPLFEDAQLGMDLMFDECYQAVPLGYILRDLKLIPFTNVINESLFVRIFYDLILSFNKMGTFEQYIFILKLIFGDDVQIEFIKTTPGEIIINVGNVDNLFRFGFITHKGEGITGEENGEGIAITGVENILNVNPYDILKLVRHITPTGAVCTLNIN